MERRAGKAAPRIKESLTGRRQLLADQRVSDWHAQMSKAGRNRLSAISNVRKLSFLLDRLDASVDEVEKLAREDPEGLRRRLNRYATETVEGGRTSNYLIRLFAALRAYLKFRRISVAPDYFPKLESVTGTSIATEKVPSQEQLGIVLDRLSVRGKVVALLMAHSGVRPQTVGMYEAADGLVLSDLPELVLTPEPHFEKIPFVILGRAALAKRRKSWTSFGSQQLATSIVAYLGERKDAGEKLAPNSPLVTAKETRGIAATRQEEARSKKGFITTTRVVFEVAHVLHATAPKGVRWRPYVLRGFFSTALLRAGVDRELREGMMAHDTGVPGAYCVGKPWGDDLIEKARKEYARACEFLETLTRPGGEDRDSELKASILRMFGYSREESETLVSNPEADVNALIRRKLGLPAGSAESVVAPPKRDGEQRVIEADAAESYLDAGWKFRSPLNGTKAVVEWTGPVP